jgi:hypothetical protein
VTTVAELRKAIDEQGGVEECHRDFVVIDGLTFEVAIRAGHWLVHVYDGDPSMENRIEQIGGELP